MSACRRCRNKRRNGKTCRRQRWEPRGIWYLPVYSVRSNQLRRIFCRRALQVVSHLSSPCASESLEALKALSVPSGQCKAAQCQWQSPQRKGASGVAQSPGTHWKCCRWNLRGLRKVEPWLGASAGTSPALRPVIGQDKHKSRAPCLPVSPFWWKMRLWWS